MARAEQTTASYKISIPLYGYQYGRERKHFELDLTITNTKDYQNPKMVTIRPAGEGRGNQFNFTNSDPELVGAMAKALAEAAAIIDQHEFKVPEKPANQE